MKRRHAARIAVATGLALVAGGCSASRDLASGAFDPHEDGTLTVATALPAAGFWQGDDAASSTGGFEWGIAAALADRFDLRLQVVDVPFARLVAGDLGGADLALSQISITDHRGKTLDFSVPYYETAPAVLAPTGETIDDLATAKEQRWVTVAGSTEADYLDSTIEPDDPWLGATDEVAAAAEVLAGRADAALIDLPSALILAAREPALEVVARFPTDERYGVALPDGSGDNVQAVDVAIRAMRADGTIDDLEDEWLRPVFGTDPSHLPVIRTADR